MINELNLDDKHYKPNTVLNRISGAKNARVARELAIGIQPSNTLLVWHQWPTIKWASDQEAVTFLGYQPIRS